MQRIIFRIIAKQIDKTITERRKKIDIINKLLVKARQCKNAEYEDELKIARLHHNHIINIATDLLEIFN